MMDFRTIFFSATPHIEPPANAEAMLAHRLNSGDAKYNAEAIAVLEAKIQSAGRRMV